VSVESGQDQKIVTLIKDGTLNVLSTAQGEQVRVAGKKRADLQEASALPCQSDSCSTRTSTIEKRSKCHLE